MSDLLIVRHEDIVGPGLLAEVAAAARVATRTVRPDLGDPLPGGATAVVVLGGFMGAYDTDVHPWLDDEKSWLRDLVAAEVPVLGICLGAQLLADALGGRAFLAPTYECAYPVITRTAAGDDDPVIAHLDGPVLCWHEDTFTLPRGATLLASSALAPQAFRAGSALGVQFHPEADPATVEAWIAHVGEAAMRARGADPDALRAVLATASGEVERAGRRVLAAWLDVTTEQRKR